jgi:hypothetical protein
MVVGGDINASRTRYTKGERRVQPWWRTFYKRNFQDAIHEVSPVDGVDYIFTRTRIAAAEVDKAYRRRVASGTRSYYSDHRLRWALLGGWRPDPYVSAAASTAARLSWRKLPGARWIRIERSKVGADKWELEARVEGGRVKYFDWGLEPLTRYRYRLVAFNGAEMSNPSPTRRVRTKRDKLGPHRPKTPHLKIKTSPLGMGLWWKPVTDRGGSGLDGYEVWQQRLGRDPERIGRTQKNWFVDKEFTRRPGLEYFVVAYDRVGNSGSRSEPASLLP